MKRDSKTSRILRMAVVLFVLIAVFCTPVEAAGVKTTYRKGFSYFKKGNAAKANRFFKKLPVNASGKKVKKMSSKMKKAYRKAAKKLLKGNPYGGYYLTDIDKDGKIDLLVIPEEDMNGAICYVYSYKGGKAVSIGQFYSSYMSELYYYPIGNGVVWLQSRMLGQEMKIVSIKSGKLKESKFYSLTVSSVSDYVQFPYKLDNHRTGSGYDYSPLT